LIYFQLGEGNYNDAQHLIAHNLPKGNHNCSPDLWQVRQIGALAV
jgi:hypothetical protein